MRRADRSARSGPLPSGKLGRAWLTNACSWENFAGWVVKGAQISHPESPVPRPSPLKRLGFPPWHGACSEGREPRAWESRRIRTKPERRHWEMPVALVHRGAVPMENNYLIGLSRQIALQRELDVIANNIANVNTVGYKADGNVFEEFIGPVARSDEFARPDRRPSFVIDRATWHDLSTGAVQQTGN